MTAELRMPDLDLPGAVITACSWYAPLGARVVEGDRLLEILAGEVTVDLAAPASGKLVERYVEIDDRLAVGQLLAIVDES